MSGPEASSRPTDSRSPSVPRPRLPRQLFWYLVVGGLTVVVDIGLLALLHESYGVPLGLATTVAFCTAVVVNFLLNRTAMSSRGSRGLTQHALRYGSLVVANYVITLAVVTTAGHVGDRYLVAKVAVVAASTLWNFLLYRHWVFAPPRPPSSKQHRVRVSRHHVTAGVTPKTNLSIVQGGLVAGGLDGEEDPVSTGRRGHVGGDVSVGAPAAGATDRERTDRSGRGGVQANLHQGAGSVGDPRGDASDEALLLLGPEVEVVGHQITVAHLDRAVARCEHPAGWRSSQPRSPPSAFGSTTGPAVVVARGLRRAGGGGRRG